MKKRICLLIAAIMLISLAACGGKTPEPEIGEWTRQGSFEDGNGNYLIVSLSEMEGYEGWGVTFVLDGETTLGEYWETNPRSHCHDMMGHIVEWFYNGIGGIRPVKPGFKQVEIRPYLPKSMNHAKVSYQTLYGPITVEMTRKETEVDFQVQVPAEVAYTVNDVYLK